MCERPAPRTVEQFGEPMYAGSWRITANGETLTWDQYKNRHWREIPLFLRLAALASIAAGGTAGEEDDDNE